jgi:putative component of membrane protein insertase Oxa1/YidC/SpoIIIJ protein YidD
MFRKLIIKVLFVTYQVLRQARYMFLLSFFGVVSHCKHSPTCGSYTFKKIENEGFLRGLLSSFKKVLSCHSL